MIIIKDTLTITLSEYARKLDKIVTIIKMYERQIGNLKWHLETNSSIINESKKELINTQIRERKDFITYLKAI